MLCFVVLLITYCTTKILNLTQIKETMIRRRSRIPKNTLSVVDNRTGKTYTIPIKNHTINALALKEINADGEGLMYVFMNTQQTQNTNTPQVI